MTPIPLRRAVYAGSFDPPTNGHLWMIAEAQNLFDELIVAIGINPEKKSTYTVAQRKQMLQAMIAPYPNVRVASFENQFLVNYANSVQARFIVRGIRSNSDYEYERAIRHINADLQPNIQTVFLMPPREITEISSTMVKGLIGVDGWQQVVSRYVPPAVHRLMLQTHLS
ncbi:pantetheine-phosphate adenylyltransferase [Alysiella filiformis]|uniref:Phosphopantetheine adenylyltransferase n=1 Tax=Alysiella filiformis DSM 16848 TaxID=1120981 RepID=A0A286EMY5_9NEIS|nr:pantetheine-phosphate adenylyltransferase [Alysiella filiformis]QMT31988.1 pantetheine-phosphate adenylyltransferase [Alysiella filiformis]UBQ57104.1 pantetheine-phosphate adenylyltransferase [Alysiella filiformis DSM 16848]SOD72291.1 Phosphopantetheine adenylyltransferase [Alysiella filiformis DSM 16848]